MFWHSCCITSQGRCDTRVPYESALLGTTQDPLCVLQNLLPLLHHGGEHQENTVVRNIIYPGREFPSLLCHEELMVHAVSSATCLRKQKPTSTGQSFLWTYPSNGGIPCFRCTASKQHTHFISIPECFTPQWFWISPSLIHEKS